MTVTNYTRDTKLAALCCTLGIPLRQEDPIVRIVEGGRERITYFFETNSTCGKWTFKEVCSLYAKDDLNTTDPENPINYVKAAFHNRERLLDLINKAQPLGMINKGSKCLLISMNASEQMKNKLFKLL
jgi:hypothetical protein